MKGRRKLRGLQLSVQFSGWMLIVIVSWSLLGAGRQPCHPCPQSMSATFPPYIMKMLHGWESGSGSGSRSGSGLECSR